LANTLAAALEQEPWLRTAGAVAGPGRCLAVIRGHDAVLLHAEDANVDGAVLPSMLLAVVEREQRDPAAALKRLRAGVRVLVGGIATVVRAQDATELHP
jgi:hypothetical protein